MATFRESVTALCRAVFQHESTLDTITMLERVHCFRPLCLHAFFSGHVATASELEDTLLWFDAETWEQLEDRVDVMTKKLATVVDGQLEYYIALGTPCVIGLRADANRTKFVDVVWEDGGPVWTDGEHARPLFTAAHVFLGRPAPVPAPRPARRFEWPWLDFVCAAILWSVGTFVFGFRI